MDEVQAMPAVTARQMAAVDRAMVEAFHLETLQIMELAGRAVAGFARAHFFGGDPQGKRVVILAGSGGNGGDGMVAGRHLHNWGAHVETWLSHQPGTLHGPAAHQAAALAALGAELHPPEPEESLALPPAELLIDALLGFSVAGPPLGATAELIRAANASGIPILAVDLPSGLEPTSGVVFDPCIQAATTLTLALPKTGLLAAAAEPVRGELYAADIGIPPEAIESLGVTVGRIFAKREFIRLM